MVTKIADIPMDMTCFHPEHRPPDHLVLEPGVYAHTCPGCGCISTFTVPRPHWR